MSPLPCPLAVAASRFASQYAWISSFERVTYAELDASVEQLAVRFKSDGVRPSDRVGLLATRDIKSITAFWAILRAGATVCALNPHWPPSAIQRARWLANIRWTITDQECVKLNEFEGPPPPPPRDNSDVSLVDAVPATIIFSSGSTGSPKAIAHHLDAHLASAEGSNQNLNLASGDAWLLSLPLFHVSGLGILFRCTIAGATVIAPSNDRSLLEPIQCHRPTHLSLVPTQLSRLLATEEKAPEYLRAVLVGGAPLPLGLVERAHDAKWPLFTTYGLSEMASQVTTTSPHASVSELRTAGRVLSRRELIIADDHEIKVRGETLFQGYVQGDRIACPLDVEGWFPTGDLGRWDATGRLIVTGRRDNRFISGGENIYPEEIERVLLDRPGVHQVIVVPIPSHEYGHRPVAFIDSSSWQVESWRRALAERLPSFKIPDDFLAWPPQQGLKPDRRHLQSIACGQ